MRPFTVGVLASLVAAAIFSALVWGIPRIVSLFQEDKAFLDIAVAEESVGDFHILRMNVANSSKFAFDPVHFHGQFEGHVLGIGIRSPERDITLRNTNTNTISDPAWTGSLDAGEGLVIVVFADGPIRVPDLSKVFDGGYAVVAARGRLERRFFVIRSANEAESRSGTGWPRWR